MANTIKNYSKEGQMYSLETKNFQITILITDLEVFLAIFIDELSWMDTKGGELISALEHFWNGWVTARKEKNVILIVCASATYWMIDNIVNSKGGLHNRLTGTINLRPFTLAECEEYLKTKKIIFNRHQIINVCEMKYSESDYVPDLRFDKAMRRKISDLKKATKTKYAIHSTLVTNYDVGESSYSGNIQSVISGEDLFK